MQIDDYAFFKNNIIKIMFLILLVISISYDVLRGKEKKAANMYWLYIVPFVIAYVYIAISMYRSNLLNFFLWLLLGLSAFLRINWIKTNDKDKNDV